TAQPEKAALGTGEALVAGYGTALTVAAGILIAAGLLSLTTLSARPATEQDTLESAGTSPAQGN
ncbi:hypothetical protein ACN6LI_000281, partial [Streptomyces violaceoruber]